jgi:hypothetical protein
MCGKMSTNPFPLNAMSTQDCSREPSKGIVARVLPQFESFA